MGKIYMVKYKQNYSITGRFLLVPPILYLIWIWLHTWQTVAVIFYHNYNIVYFMILFFVLYLFYFTPVVTMLYAHCFLLTWPCRYRYVLSKCSNETINVDDQACNEIGCRQPIAGIRTRTVRIEAVEHGRVLQNPFKVYQGV